MIWHCGGQKPFILESSLEGQSLATKEMVEHLPYGQIHEEEYVSMDWVDRNMMDMDTLWGTFLVIISRALDSIAHTGHHTVQRDIGVCHSIQDYTLAHGGAQHSFGVFPLGRPPNRFIEYTIGLSLPMIGEWVREPQQAVYPSMIDFHLVYHQAWAKEQGTHRSILSIIMSSWSCPWE
jgi:hypothetical protein